jgi:hypothetical protein
MHELRSGLAWLAHDRAALPVEGISFDLAFVPLRPWLESFANWVTRT